jgi:rubrerythrin
MILLLLLAIGIVFCKKMSPKAQRIKETIFEIITILAGAPPINGVYDTVDCYICPECGYDDIRFHEKQCPKCKTEFVWN